MASTSWFPRHRNPGERERSWLLGNGEVVQEPPLEESGSGLKFRVPGTKITGYRKDLDQILLDAVTEVAQQRNTYLWMAVGNPEFDGTGQAYAAPALDYTKTGTRASNLHLFTRHDFHAKSVLWWSFKHPKLPIEARLTLRVMAQYGTTAASLAQTISVILTLPSTDPDYSASPKFHNEIDTFSGVSGDLGLDERGPFYDLIRNGAIKWDMANILAEGHRAPNERAAMIELLRIVRKIDELAEIQIPDLRNKTNPCMMTLELQDTNVHQDLISKMADYLDGAPLVEEALEHYKQMIKTLRSLGMVASGVQENTFLQAAGGGDEALTCTVATLGPDGEPEPDHHLTMHLPTGTFVITCSSPHRDKVAAAWDEAFTLASLTGQQDVLLAYARKYVETEHQKRIDKTIDARRHRSG